MLISLSRTNLFLQRVEIVNDDSNKQIEDKERTKNYERQKVYVSLHVVIGYWLVVNLEKKVCSLSSF